jgi:hypothetical protein
MDWNETAATIERALARAGLRPIARVLDGEITDFAFIAPTLRSVVVRYVDRPTISDYRALATMMADGDFDRAALIHSGSSDADLSGPVQSWPIANVRQLAASLARDGSTS